MKKKIIALTLALTLIMSQYNPVFAANDGEVLNALTNICLGYPGHPNGGLLPIYVTSAGFTPIDGTGVELESGLNTALYADTVKFHYGSTVTSTYEIIDLAAYGAGDIISLIIYGGKVYRIKGSSLAGRIGMVFDYIVKYHVDSAASATFHTTTGSGLLGGLIPHDESINIPDGYTSDIVLSGQTTISSITANNVLDVIYTTKRTNLSYKVNYLGADGQALRPPKDVDEVVFGSSYTEEAADIAGYIPDAVSKSVTINTTGNAISFIYSRATNLSYQVEYLSSSGTALFPVKTVTGLTFGNTYSETAPQIIGYSPDAGSKSIGVTAGENKIVFRYSIRNDLSYTVSYKGPNNVELMASKNVNGVTYGSTRMETAPAITGYSHDAASKSVTIGEGVNQIVFNYTVNQAQRFNYTVRYYKDSVAGTLLRTDTGSGALGTAIPFNAVAYVPAGYANNYTLVGQTTVTEIAANNVLNVVYSTIRSDLSYTVYYRDDIGADILPPKVVNNVVFGSSHNEVAPYVIGCQYNGSGKTITISAGTNQVIFNYERVFYLFTEAKLSSSTARDMNKVPLLIEYYIKIHDFVPSDKDIYIDLGPMSPLNYDLRLDILVLKINELEYELNYNLGFNISSLSRLVFRIYNNNQAEIVEENQIPYINTYTVNYYKGYVDEGRRINTVHGKGKIGDAIPFDVAAYIPYGYKSDYIIHGQGIIASSGNVLNVVYTTLDPLIGIIQSKTLTFSTTFDKEYRIPISYKNLKSPATLKVTYDTSKLELQDITDQTFQTNLTGDPESVSRLEITPLKNGVFTLRMKPNIVNNEMNSGDITILKFKCLATGNATVWVDVV